MAALIDRPSPNYDRRKPGGPVDILLIHYTGMETAEAALERLCDPESKVSAHYVIDEDGTAYQLVKEKRRAWHAGVASWRGETDINGRSIGIELVNPGHEFEYRRFPDAQMAQLTSLASEIVLRHRIPDEGVLGHSDVAPGRKEDPGELFDWASLAASGVGLWPDRRFRPRRTGLMLQFGDQGAEVAALQGSLKSFGYGIADDGIYGDQTKIIVTEFQRHYRSLGVNGIADPETRSLIDYAVTLAARSRARRGG
jgi:N-acetylmuramoyl-L-alanine amidase